MKLKPRTTYLNKNGDRVNIAGLAKYTVDGINIFWSIQGDHYAEDGRFVSLARTEVNGEETYKKCFLPISFGRCIDKRLDTEEARAWWVGVKTN
jgi:hypothetical protein